MNKLKTVYFMTIKETEIRQKYNKIIRPKGLNYAEIELFHQNEKSC